MTRFYAYLFFVTLLLATSIGRVTAQTMYPGDVNNNGIVNHLDAIWWGLAHDATGMPRLDASAYFVEQNLPLIGWDGFFPNGISYAYADCDGSGLVDFLDFFIIGTNFGLVRDTMLSEVYSLGGNLPIPVSLVGINDSTGVNEAPGTSVTYELHVGDAEHPVQNFIGIGFTLEFDTSVISYVDVFLDGNNADWANENGNLFVASFPFVGNIEPTENEYVALGRFGAAPVSGYGRIAKVNFIIEDDVIGVTDRPTKAAVSIKDIYLLDNNFTKLLSLEDSTTISVIPNVLTTAEPTLEETVKMYPTVAKEKVHVATSNQTMITDLRLTDALGSLLYQTTAQSTHYTLELGNLHLPTGIYYLTIQTAQGRVVKKLLIQQ